jgi:acetyltransferase-like isoleucine patch superfamily enzyme
MSDLINRYGYFGVVRLFFSVFISKLLLSKKVRIVRYPFYVRGSKYIDWGNNFTSGVNLRIDADPIELLDNKYVLHIGNNVQVNDYVHIGAVNKIVIGNNVLIASKVYISDHNHGNYKGLDQSLPESDPSQRPIVSLPVFIEDNVWIGEQVSVLPGVTIGKGSIIGANSVVSKSIPPNCIAIGIPAIVVKKFNYNSSQWEKI